MVDLRHGDCLDVLRSLPDASVDAVVTDPPYGLAFMGKRWDYDVPSVEIWAECLRVLKPGGHLLAFAGTRTQHRMAVRIEDAGFEIRDMIAWVYGSGFPKSLDVSKAIDRAAGVEGTFGAPKSAAHAGWIDRGRMRGEEGHEGYQRPWMADADAVDKNARQYIGGTAAARQWQGWGTALKPALEPITVARKPLDGTVAENVLQWGTGAINVDGCRVATPDGKPAWHYPNGPGGNVAQEIFSGLNSIRTEYTAPTSGRWPANLIHDGSDEVVGLFPADEGRFFQCCNDSACLQREGGYNATDPKPEHLCHAPHPPRSSAPTAASSSSLRNAAEFTVRSVAATWGSHAVTVSSDTTAPSTNVTPTECASIVEACTVTMLSIASGCLPELRHERRTPSGSLASAVATRSPIGITTITASLSKSDGSAEHVTFSITPDCLALGAAGSRFRYCAKASRADREEGCDHLPARTGAEAVERKDGSAGLQSPRAGAGRTNGARNIHPTVKPTDLMRYLCRLVTPPGGLVLDPFMGSGSTGKAAILEGFRFIGIEREAEYVEIARARIEAITPATDEPTKAPALDDAQLSLF